MGTLGLQGWLLHLMIFQQSLSFVFFKQSRFGVPTHFVEPRITLPASVNSLSENHSVCVDGMLELLWC